MLPDLSTKLALSSSLKELISERPFKKITISDICEKCGINRKSFYYHFSDKYELINWIFDMEFNMPKKADISKLNYEQKKEILFSLCNYLYNNRSFYRKAFKITGQNSLSNHLREKSIDFFKNCTITNNRSVTLDTFAADILIDALLGAIRRWITDPKSIPPDEFVSKLFFWIETISENICTNKNQIKNLYKERN